MPADPVRQRFPELDFVRSVAIVFVVMLHSASPILYQLATVPTTVWITHAIIDSALRVCVPLFFMTTGFLLLSMKTEAEHPHREVGRRLLRIALPLIAWTIFYRLANAYANSQPVTLQFFTEGAWQLLLGAPVFHLQFLYELAILYVLLPVLRPIFANGVPFGFYFIAVWLGLAFLDFLSDLFGVLNWTGIYLNLGNSGYLVAGYLVRRRLGSPVRRETIVAVLGYAVCTTLIAVLTAKVSITSGVFTERFFVYSSFLVNVQSICAFVALIGFGQFLEHSTPRFFSGLIGLSSVSFGIYFIHVYFLERMGYNVLGLPSETPLEAVAAIVLSTLYAIALSVLFIWPLGRFKATRWLVT